MCSLRPAGAVPRTMRQRNTPVLWYGVIDHAHAVDIPVGARSCVFSGDAVAQQRRDGCDCANKLFHLRA